MENPLNSALETANTVSATPSFKNIVGLGFVFGMLVYWTFAFLILYHLIRFGVGNQPKKIALFFLAGSLVLSIIASLFLAQVIL